MFYTIYLLASGIGYEEFFFCSGVVDGPLERDRKN